MRRSQAGVVAILENDQARPCTGNRDQIEYLGASLGFPYHNYGVKTRDSTWGCSFISLYPIKVLPSPRHHITMHAAGPPIQRSGNPNLSTFAPALALYSVQESNVTVLPSPYGTRSCLIDAVLDVNGKDFNLVVSYV